jgi:hypothetical protein
VLRDANELADLVAGTSSHGLGSIWCTVQVSFGRVIYLFLRDAAVHYCQQRVTKQGADLLQKHQGYR